MTTKKVFGDNLVSNSEVMIITVCNAGLKSKINVLLDKVQLTKDGCLSPLPSGTAGALMRHGGFSATHVKIANWCPVMLVSGL